MASKMPPGMAEAYGRKMGWAVAAVALLLTANNCLPYLGVCLDGCQTMFSGLAFTEASNNHLLIPQRTISDVGVYVVDVKGRCSRRPADTGSAVLCGWLENDRRAFHLEALRSAVHRLCAAGISIELAYRMEADGGATFLLRGRLRNRRPVFAPLVVAVPAVPSGEAAPAVRSMSSALPPFVDPRARRPPAVPVRLRRPSSSRDGPRRPEARAQLMLNPGWHCHLSIVPLLVAVALLTAVLLAARLRSRVRRRWRASS